MHIMVVVVGIGRQENDYRIEVDQTGGSEKVGMYKGR